MRKPRGRYTREKIKERKTRQEERQTHIKALTDGEVDEELPEPLFPDVFKDIQDTYWHVLKLIPDPRDRSKRVYPLYLILHRIISGFLSGGKHIGVLFPIKRKKIESGKKKLGGLPTRKPVYSLLRRIDWDEANAILAPLWDRLGYTPDLVVRRSFRNPKEILNEFRKEQRQEERHRRKQLAEENEAKERAKGMSAAKAKRGGLKKKDEKDRSETRDAIKSSEREPKSTEPVKIQHDLVIDGKVVKASYNAGVKERFVHVTEIKVDEEDHRSRFIIGARPTELDRHGEWGAALSILDALIPLPGNIFVMVSGDAGFCVEEFCEWLTAKGFFLHLSDQTKRR